MVQVLLFTTFNIPRHSKSRLPGKRLGSYWCHKMHFYWTILIMMIHSLLVSSLSRSSPFLPSSSQSDHVQNKSGNSSPQSSSSLPYFLLSSKWSLNISQKCNTLFPTGSTFLIFIHKFLNVNSRDRLARIPQGANLKNGARVAIRHCAVIESPITGAFFSFFSSNNMKFHVLKIVSASIDS